MDSPVTLRFAFTVITLSTGSFEVKIKFEWYSPVYKPEASNVIWMSWDESAGIVPEVISVESHWI